jgi:hypothetical protein
VVCGADQGIVSTDPVASLIQLPKHARWSV